MGLIGEDVSGASIHGFASVQGFLCRLSNVYAWSEQEQLVMCTTACVILATCTSVFCLCATCTQHGTAPCLDGCKDCHLYRRAESESFWHAPCLPRAQGLHRNILTFAVL